LVDWYLPFIISRGFGGKTGLGNSIWSTTLFLWFAKKPLELVIALRLSELVSRLFTPSNTAPLVAVNYSAHYEIPLHKLCSSPEEGILARLATTLP